MLQSIPQSCQAQQFNFLKFHNQIIFSVNCGKGTQQTAGTGQLCTSTHYVCSAVLPAIQEEVRTVHSKSGTKVKMNKGSKLGKDMGEYCSISTAVLVLQYQYCSSITAVFLAPKGWQLPVLSCHRLPAVKQSAPSIPEGSCSERPASQGPSV